jgi:WD40 repeat protein
LIWTSQPLSSPAELAWSDDATELIVSGLSTGNSSPVLTTLSRETGEVLSTLETGDNIEFRMESLCADPVDGTLIGLRINRQIDRIDPSTRKITPVCAGPALMTQVEWHPDSHRTASGGTDSRIAIWNTDQPALVKSVRMRHGCFALTWSPDGSKLAAGGDGRQCTLLSDSGRQLGNLTQEFATDCHALTFGRSSDQLLRGGRNAALRLYSLQSGRFTDLFDGDVRSLAWSNKANHFAAGTETGEIRLWDSKGQPGAVLQGHSLHTDDLAWRPGGWELASVAQKFTDGSPELFLWSWGDPRPRRLPLAGSEGSCLTWSPDGDILAVGCGNGTIQRLRPGVSADAARSVDTLTGHAARILSIDWSPDGKSLLSSCADGTVRLWDAEKGRHLWVGIPLPDGTAAIFSTAGELLYGDPAVVDQQFVYMIKDDDGRLELLTHSQFQQRLSATDVSE